MAAASAAAALAAGPKAVAPSSLPLLLPLPRSRQFELYHASRESFVYLRQFYMVSFLQPGLVRLERISG